MFGMCTLFLIICLACQRHFASILHWEQVGWWSWGGQGADSRAEVAADSPCAWGSGCLHGPPRSPCTKAPYCCCCRLHVSSSAGAPKGPATWAHPRMGMCMAPPVPGTPTRAGPFAQAGSHFNEDQHLEAGSKGVEFAKLAGSEEEASGSVKAAAAGATS